jgi:hypothetical protein
MRHFFTAVCVLALLGGSAGAQELSQAPRNSGYVFAAPGAISVNVSTWTESTLQIGAGYERVLFKGLGIGIDGGALGVADSQSGRHWTPAFCLNGFYEFGRTSSRKLSPFVTAGLTAVPEFDVGGGYDIGGGVKYWFDQRYGVRIEFRDHARPGQLHTYHDLQVRVGFSFR